MTSQSAGREEWLDLPDDDIITGEAVALDLPAASLGVRAVAGLIDIVVVIVVLIGASFLLVIAFADASESLAATVTLVASVGALLVLPVTIETLTRGRSLGKLALGVRTVRDDGGPISFRHAFTRHLVGVVEIYVLTGVPALISGLVTTRCKRLGDLVAGTHVVRERFSLDVTAPPPMPQHLAAWASAADVAALPQGLTVGVRQFLLRAPSLDPVRRDHLGRDLASRVSAYVAPLPPQGTHAEYFLAAVLAERRRRDGQRLASQRVLRDRLRAAVRH